MNFHVFCIHISIMVFLRYALSKNLPEAFQIDSEPEVAESVDDTESIHEANRHSFEYSHSDNVKKLIRRRRASGEISSFKNQCAVMYKNDEPVGILQPYKDSYQFMPIRSDEQIPVDISPYTNVQNAMKRDTALNTEDDEDAPEVGDETLKKVDDNSRFSDDRYPYIFAKFKIDSRIEKPYGSNKQRAPYKRKLDEALVAVNKRAADSLSSTLSRIQRTNDEGAEVELRSILSDMGLIDDETHLDKREAELNEDEDLEHGTNKINLIKLDNIEERSKREGLSEKHAKRSESATKHYDMIEIPEPKSINEEEYIDQYLNKNEDQSEKQNKKDVEKRSEDMAAQMEREIQSKLQKIKEEVRNEIDQIKSGSSNVEFETDGEDKEQMQLKEKSQRRKRHVISTLTDEETSDINPVESGDNRLVPHIRRRRKRGILDEDISSKKEDSIKKLFKRSNQEAEFLFLNLIDSVDDETESNLIIDLNPEVKSTEKSSSIIQSKRATDEEITKKNILKSKSNDNNYDQRIETDGVEIPDFEIKRSLKNIGSENQTLTVNSPAIIKEYTATTEDHFLMRNLKEYDGEDDANFETDNDQLISKDKTRDKKSCKCNTGEKDCKCGKAPAPVRLLKGSDGTNFVYIDDVPRLADGPPSFKLVSSEHQKNPAVKINLGSNASAKKRSAKENIKYHKSVVNFAKSLRDGGYTLDIDPDVYRITEQNPRRKRDSFADLVAIHGGGPVINHLVAIRERSMLPRIRVKRGSNKDQTDQQLTLKAMSDEDLFGALPQSFDGELARYKRVKRRS